MESATNVRLNWREVNGKSAPEIRNSFREFLRQTGATVRRKTTGKMLLPIHLSDDKARSKNYAFNHGDVDATTLS